MLNSDIRFVVEVPRIVSKLGYTAVEAPAAIGWIGYELFKYRACCCVAPCPAIEDGEGKGDRGGAGNLNTVSPFKATSNSIGGAIGGVKRKEAELLRGLVLDGKLRESLRRWV